MKTFLSISISLFFLHIGPLHADQAVLYPQTFYSVKTALSKAFSGFTKIERKKHRINPEKKKLIEDRLGWEISDSEWTILSVYKQDRFMGYAIVLDELGKYYPITFMTTINPEFTVNEVVLMVYREKIGVSVRKNRFLRQFQKKSSQDSFIVDQDIMGISGATVSSWAMSSGVKKALVLTEELTKTL